MASKSILFQTEARDKLLKGVEQLAKAVAVTLGPKGRHVILEKSFGSPVITKDGVSVAKDIELEDKFENMGAQLVKEVASKTNDVAGDGTTTATVLAREIFKQGRRLVDSGMNPMEVKRGIDKAAKKLPEIIKSLAIPCDDFKTIQQVATISANNDQEIGSLIAEAMQKVSKNGVISVEEGRGIENQLKVVEGMQFDRGYVSPYFVTKPETGTVELENPAILLVDKKVSNVREMMPVLEACAKAGKSLLLIAEEIEGEVLPSLILNNARGILKSAAVKSPGFGDRRKATMQDLAILTGGKLISDELGGDLEKVTLEDFGTAARVVITKDHTTIIDGAGQKEAIQSRVSEIKRQLHETTSEYDASQLRERIAKLVGGVAVIEVGAATEVEMKEKKARVEDALHATRAAVEEGIVPGGGVALLRVSQKLNDLRGDNDEQTAGIRLALRAMEAPLRQIVENAGQEASVVVNEVLKGNGNFGYNLNTNEYGDMFAMGVVDPAKVTRLAFLNAESIASIMLTTEAMVAENPKIEKPAAPAGGGFGGMM